LQYSTYQIARLSLIAALLILPFERNSLSQPSKTPKRPAPRKIGFAEAQKLLANENEGNLSKQPGKFSRTKLSGGQVLEVYYPITAPDPRRKLRPTTVPGYGLLYESELTYKEANRVPHVLEDLIPDSNQLVGDIPQLVARRAVGGEWRVRKDEVFKYPEPNIMISGGGKKEIKPWSGLISILYDEEKRGPVLTKLFDADSGAAR
jgi:hypothetical protein